MNFNPAPTAWRVTRINEDLRCVEVTLSLVEWATDDETSGEGDESVFTPADPGQPGAFWMNAASPTSITLTLGREQAMFYDVGRHYVMDLREVVDAPQSEFEPA